MKPKVPEKKNPQVKTENLKTTLSKNIFFNTSTRLICHKPHFVESSEQINSTL